ncbi:hypothetical protein NIES2098_34570 [Calothrix sp. NIES-2098]|nr:hypothetical protein NIES2098_34570 [Calothrix sp. NIES-2098]
MNLYTTPEAAKLTNIPESTIRTWLSRYPGVFQLDTHLIVDEHKQKLWTEAGIELLRSRRETKNETEDGSILDSGDFLEELLENDATKLAREYWRQLPGRVLQRIVQMRDNPSAEDRQIVQTSVRAAINAGTSRLLLPTYQPMLLEGNED